MCAFLTVASYKSILVYDSDFKGDLSMPTLETLLIANHAEAINGLLYMSGAGWTDMFRAVPPKGSAPSNHFGVAVTILVSWNETNRKYHLTIRLETDDSREVAKVEADMEMGRPPGLPPGSDLRAVVAINFDIQFPSAGGYRIVGQIGEEPPRSVSFRVRDVPVALPPGATAG
jgi:hypothetical protein